MSQEAIESIYTIPFYPLLNKTKEFILKHTKADVVQITEELNEFMWRRGIQKPPRKVKVKAIIETIDEEKIATVELIKEKVTVAERPELEGISIPGELEEEEEEEEEEDTEPETNMEAIEEKK
ncbi:MAG: hypothetical protein ACTSRO_08680 [Candidatus Heimdallarchaeaceae archaeon]